MNIGSPIDRIKEIILASIPGATVYVADPNLDGQHFEAVVVSPVFEGLMLVKQHQLVMNALKQEFKENVHALALKTFTPSKWEEVKDQYPNAGKI